MAVVVVYHCDVIFTSYTLQVHGDGRPTVQKLVLDDELAGWVGTRFLGRRTPRYVHEVVARLYVLNARPVRF